MPTILRGGTLITPQKILSDHALVIEEGRIAEVLSAQEIDSQVDDAQVIEAGGLWVIPGLIDVHVHGAAGSDTMDATPAALQSMASFFLKHGVTSYLPTTITASPQAIQSAVDNVKNLSQPLTGAQHLGMHLEGPYLCVEYSGAQPSEWLRAPDPQEYERWLIDVIRLVTLAPELPGALDMIAAGVRRGIRFSVGHSKAGYDQVVEAANRGLSHATHTFNGMVGLHHREPGTVGAILVDERIYAEVIADGVHLHPAVVKLLVRAKGPDRTILVTDAIRATGLEDGEYDLGGHMVRVHEGIARTARGGLAGSTLTLNAAVRNVIQFTGIPIPEALAMATTTPAAMLGLAGRKGVLQKGADADLVLVDPSWNVWATMINGLLVYDRRKARQNK